MSQRPRTLNAWKHGGYSNLGVLPGEDPREFERLHQSLIDEWEPSGPTEHDAVLSIAKCLWRKSRLTVYAQAEVRKHLAVDFNDPLQAAWDAYDEQSRKAAQLPLSDELKRALKLESKDRAKQQIKQQLAEFDEQQVTPESLVKEIELEGRLDARIDRLVKRLFQLKAGKQMLVADSCLLLVDRELQLAHLDHARMTLPLKLGNCHLSLSKVRQWDKSRSTLALPAPPSAATPHGVVAAP